MAESELTYSTEGLSARVPFYEGLNDINIYTEDAESQYFYEEIFKRMLKEKYKISSIFPCGGKPKVIDAFNENGKETNGLKNIFLVDGDFDEFLFPEKVVKDEQFIYLKNYNIENCIINEDGASEIVRITKKMMGGPARSLLNFTSWKSRAISEFKELFLCYCYIQKFDPSIPNVNRSPNEFIDEKTGFLRTNGRFQQFRDNLFKSHPNAALEIENIKKSYETIHGNDYYPLICGKFLLASLEHYIHSLTKEPTNRTYLFWFMIERFDTSELDYVKNACLKAEGDSSI